MFWQSVAREVAIWKKLDNMHCVQLFEVIDDAAGGHIYMISEYIRGGCVMPDKLQSPPLPVRRARHYFRQVRTRDAKLSRRRGPAPALLPLVCVSAVPERPIAPC